MKGIKNNLDKILISLLVVVAISFGMINKYKSKNVDNEVHFLNESNIVDENKESKDTFLESNMYIENSQKLAKQENVIKIQIHITGCVKNPDVYTVEEGSRINDVIKLAGGLCENPNLESINLSKKVTDEMKIHIYKIGEDIKTTNILEDSLDKNNTIENEKKLVNINNASLEELMKLSGIGESKAKYIIEYRKNNKFNSIEDLRNVSGIGDKLFEKIKDLITIN